MSREELSEDITEEQAYMRKALRLLDERIKESDYKNRKNTVGRILTITDAMVSDPEQRKALKDLILNAFWNAPYPTESDITWELKIFALAYNFKLYPSAEYVEDVSAEPVNVYKDLR